MSKLIDAKGLHPTTRILIEQGVKNIFAAPTNYTDLIDHVRVQVGGDKGIENLTPGDFMVVLNTLTEESSTRIRDANAQISRLDTALNTMTTQLSQALAAITDLTAKLEGLQHEHVAPPSPHDLGTWKSPEPQAKSRTRPDGAVKTIAPDMITSPVSGKKLFPVVMCSVCLKAVPRVQATHQCVQSVGTTMLCMECGQVCDGANDFVYQRVFGTGDGTTVWAGHRKCVADTSA